MIIIAKEMFRKENINWMLGDQKIRKVESLKKFGFLEYGGNSN